jgi:demethylmenaquinone methyltransferase/2-methoxy-6-polyprenyl-1,4-benzoquinol methylase
MTSLQEPARIRGMFASIAGTYDCLNHVLSLNQDHGWRRAAVAAAGVREGDVVLDVCTGTGDLALELARAAGRTGRVVGTDFCEAMVRLGVPKVERERAAVDLGVADTLRLPFRDGSFRAVTVGFGIRNVADLGAGIREMARVTAPGGRIAILEFTQPANWLFRFVYYVYFLVVLPILGNLVSGGKRNAYGYLPRSVLKFPGRDRLAKIVAECGLTDVKVHARTLGIITVHVGTKPAAPNDAYRGRTRGSAPTADMV